MSTDSRGVRAIAECLASTHEGECLLALDRVLALAQVQPALVIVHVLLEADLDATDRIDDALEPAEVDHHEVVDIEAGHFLDGLDRASGAGDVEGGVELALVAADRLAVGLALRESDEGVAGDAHRNGALAVGTHVKQDRRVGAGSAELRCASVAAVVLAAAAVAAHEQDREGLVAARLVDRDRSVAFTWRATELVRDVDGGDVALQPAHHCVHADPGEGHGNDHSGEGRCENSGPSAACGLGHASGCPSVRGRSGSCVGWICSWIRVVPGHRKPDTAVHRTFKGWTQVRVGWFPREWVNSTVSSPG